MNSRMLIRCRWLITGQAGASAIEDGAVVVEDGRVRAAGPYASLAGQGPFKEEFGDAGRHILLPGLVNGHHHATRPGRMGLTAGPLETWILKNRARPLPPLSEEETYDHTLWGALQLLKGGVTTVLDHHTGDPRLPGQGLEPSIRAYLDSGMRTVFALACSDQQRFVYAPDREFFASLPEPLRQRMEAAYRPFDADALFALWEQVANAYHGREGRLWLGFAPGGPQWCSEPLLRRMKRVAVERGASIQIHLGETRYQLQYFQRARSCTPVAYLQGLGFLGPDVSCAHGVWTTAEDWKLLAETGASVVHNPSSNLILASGIAPVAEMLAAGVTVGFGLDAAGINDTMDYLPDLRLGWLLQRRPGVTAERPTPGQMLELACRSGARALALQGELGSLEPGKQADLVLLDGRRLYDSPYVHPRTPVEEVVLRRGMGSDVEAVMVGGEWVIRDGRCLRADEAALRQRLGASMERFLGPAAEPSLADELEPHVAAFFASWDEGELPPPNYGFNTR